MAQTPKLSKPGAGGRPRTRSRLWKSGGIGRAAQAEVLKAYQLRLVAEGRGVPAHHKRPDDIWWTQVRRETGLNQEIQAVGCVARLAVEAMASEIGLTVVRGLDVITLGRFKQKALAERERNLRARTDMDLQGRKKALANLRWALGCVSKVYGDRSAARESIEGLLHDPDTAGGSLRAELSWCLRFLAVNEADADLPDDFGGALRRALTKAGQPRRTAAATIGMNEGSLSNWMNGMCGPSQRSMHLVAALERLCNLPEGSLASRVRFRRSGKGSIPRNVTLPPDFPARSAQRKRLLVQLPNDIATMEQSARDTLIGDLCDRLREEQVRRDRVVERTAGQPYRLSLWPRELQEEWSDLVRFKGEAALERLTDEREGKRWRRGTQEIVKSHLSSLFGFLTHEQRPGALPVADLSLAYLVFSGKLSGLFLRFRSERNAKFDPARGAYITGADITGIHFVKALLKPETGWLTQRPELAARLRPVDGIATAEDIDRVRADWAGACADANRACRRLVRAHEQFVARGRNSHEAVLPILKFPNPLSALRKLNSELRIVREATASNTLAGAYALRDQVLGGIVAQYPLRPETLSLIDHPSEGTGHLRQEEGRWRLCISRLDFKNWESPYFRVGHDGWRDFDEELLDVEGLYDAIEDYIAWGRPLLLAGPAKHLALRTPALFVLVPHRNKVGQVVRRERMVVRPEGGVPPAIDPGRMTADHIADRFLLITGRHLVWRESTGSGIPGVRPFAPQACRHIVATGVLKLTRGDYSAAADAIQDDIPMIRNTYGRYLPTDRRHVVRRVFEEAYEGDLGFEADRPASPRDRLTLPKRSAGSGTWAEEISEPSRLDHRPPAWLARAPAARGRYD
ncbi:hypothetical protein [Methylobacterium haplocladii]|uniref:Uncharacterized protein n=1 Tax=Methylobacterium haplocladii TaxID=1176176 RepID=A0A512IJF8_9HYPH|nr:hypothetical protein [Methylobacterium haplocladii]GEO97831.1 hypothetical protein MHA02_02190 [Methylobacterium haplocladii]GJD82677.1 hypothetical protein HPGCJGGD_0536 [Methylobacterium haplocladii]GLS57536.1 hypothetical protein GCM10007887_01910 [Methylobacterium haplocladii]